MYLFTYLLIILKYLATIIDTSIYGTTYLATQSLILFAQVCGKQTYVRSSVGNLQRLSQLYTTCGTYHHPSVHTT